MSNSKRSPRQNNARKPARPNSSTKVGAPQRTGLGCSVALALLLVGLVATAAVAAPRLLGFLDNATAGRPVRLGEAPLAQELAARRAQENTQLQSYGWVDQSAGVAHIPIDRAIALVAQSGLPVGVVATATPSAAATAPTTTTQNAAPVDLTQVNYQDNILPIFTQHCAECHGHDDPEEGLELTTYKTAMVGSVYGAVIKPGDPDNSYLVEMVVSGKMPKKGAPLTQTEIDTIIAWIKAGAPEFGPAGPTASATTAPTTTTALTATTAVTATTPVTDSAVTGSANITATAPVTTSVTGVITDSAAATVTTPATTTSTISGTATLTATGAVSATAPVDLANVSFQADVLPIFTQYCSKCHGSDEPEEGLELTSYQKVMVGSVYGKVIEPGDVENSYLAKMITSGKMPKKGGPLSQLQIDTILAWIKAGAPDN
ncbi:MAG: c-type cytochrome domain-containing protein [Caldilineaceae bacterium]